MCDIVVSSGKHGRSLRMRTHFETAPQLFYPDRLRIVIPTANFVDYDWAHIENVRIYVTFLALSIDLTMCLDRLCPGRATPSITYCEHPEG